MLKGLGVDIEVSANEVLDINILKKEPFSGINAISRLIYKEDIHDLSATFVQ